MPKWLRQMPLLVKFQTIRQLLKACRQGYRNCSHENLRISPTHRFDDLVPFEKRNLPWHIRENCEENLTFVNVKNLPKILFWLVAALDSIFHFLYRGCEVNVVIDQCKKHNNDSNQLNLKRDISLDFVRVRRNKENLLVFYPNRHEATPLYSEIEKICSAKDADQSEYRLSW